MKEETTFKRPTDYSQFHRSLGPCCYAIDVDYVEWREGRGIVALVCVTGMLNDEGHIYNSKPYIWDRTTFERKVIVDMARRLCVPCYYVIHTKDLKCFHVHDIDNINDYKVMNDEEFKRFIKGL